MHQVKERIGEEPKTALNVVLFPDKIASNQAKLYRQRVSNKFETEFVLDSTHIPHITLYQGYYPDRNISNLLTSLTKLPVWDKNFKLKMEGFSVSRNNFLWWNTVKDKPLKDLHEAVMNASNDLREGNISPNVFDMMDGLSAEEKDMVKRTGSVLNLDMFNPHITLTRLKKSDDSADVLNYLGNSDIVTFRPEAIYVTKLGQHGTVSEVVDEIFYR